MPVIQNSNYQVPFWMINEHMETVLPGLLRNPKRPAYKQERISTPDHDFLDLLWKSNSCRRAVVLSHGLEGHGDKYYMRGMARKFLSMNWDVVSWNCRSCSDEINLTPNLYHHGATEDLDTIIQHTLSKGYEQVLLLGLSLGGSLVVKYLGENACELPSEIVGGIAFSIPCQLGSCAKKLSEPGNSFYLNRFLKKLKSKIRRKAEQFQGIFDLNGLDEISTFYQFDTKYTAPLYGFESVEAFYSYASAGNYIEGIKVPTLLVNSLNDPMLPEDCYPFFQAKNHKYFYLETPKRGGHLGYWWPGQKQSWSEKRAAEFVTETIGIR